MAETLTKEPFGDEWIKNLSDSNLQELISELKERTKLFNCENESFQRYIDRVDPRMEDVTQGLVQEASDAEDADHIRPKPRSEAADRTLRLSWEQKVTVVQSEQDAYKHEINGLEKTSEALLHNYRAELEALVVIQKEINKSSNEFSKSFATTGRGDLMKPIYYEKFLKFIQDSMRQRDTIVDKLRLKNSALHTQLRKSREQLRQKEELGEVLRPVDFEQLKIDNSECLRKIDERNQEIQRLKLVAGKTLQVLNAYKLQLTQAIKEKERIKLEIAQRLDIKRRAKSEMVTVKKEVKEETKANKEFQEHKSSYNVPSVIDLIKLKSEEREIIRKELIHRRKLHLAQMALDRHKKIWLRIRHATADTIA
ncbi:Coiled-coil domain-containing protein 113 [Clonorchis sinensis]|uniref:Cilia- and flagella-associated protein 263 n=1 Tax=Clonorchis sinensis TaxID=79923 RepID=A0A8T1M4B2_CLOSI|nr:Coiled-coil domain-containing protein 113 [Clonorchis sinensis]